MSSLRADQVEFSEEAFNTPYHAMLAEAIHQANQVESVIDDILAAEHLKRQATKASLRSYFDYLERKLWGKTIAAKIRCLLEAPTVKQILSDNEIGQETVEQLFSEWRKLRNRFTHGLIVWSSSSIPVLYHTGYCYDIESHVTKFFQLNERVLAVISVLEVRESDYAGTPLLLDDNCDLDHPIYAVMDNR